MSDELSAAGRLALKLVFRTSSVFGWGGPAVGWAGRDVGVEKYRRVGDWAPWAWAELFER